VNAGFLSWDLNALLFSDTDPSFTTKTRYSALRGSYTRASQEPPLKALNAGAYLTLKDPQALPGRFALARELLEGWYGGTNLPSATFSSTYTPAGWQVAGLDGVAGTGDDNPAAAPALYHEVFGPHCRACHIYQIPNAAAANAQFGTGDPRVAALCNSDASDDAGSSVSSADQLPIACYRQLVAAPVLGEVLNDGRMPLARLTLDRLWTPPPSGTSAGQKLAAHLADIGITMAAPGSQGPCIDSFGTEVQENGTTKHQVARGEVIRPTTECSHVLTGAQWTLQSPASSGATMVGANTSTPAFTADRQGDYLLTLRDASGATTTITAMIPVEAPVVGSGARNVVLSAGPASLDINIAALPGFRAPDALSSIEVLTQSDVTATVLDTTNLRLSTSALAGGSMTYRVTDVDGDVSNIGTITVSVSASIAANDATINVTANSSLNVELAPLVSVPTGQTFSLVITQQPTRNRGRGTGAASAPTPAGRTTYVAPLGVLSHFGGISVDATDSFEYRACFVDQPGTCDTGTITVRLNGTRSFANVRTDILGSCAAACHENVQVGAALVMNGAISSKQLYCNIRTGTSVTGSTGTEAAGTAYVNIGTPTSSLVYRKPSGLDNHFGGTFSTVAAAVLEWLDEGAYFTEGANQTCPP
jgi:hypothetical protein